MTAIYQEYHDEDPLLHGTEPAYRALDLSRVIFAHAYLISSPDGPWNTSPTSGGTPKSGVPSLFQFTIKAFAYRSAPQLPFALETA